MSDEFVNIARISDIANNQCKLVCVDGVEIAVWNVEGRFFAINNVCPHQHFSSLHQGTLDGLFVTCPMHGWSFNLEDGRPGFGNGCARTYRVKILGKDVLVERPTPSW
jgi:nitrite reductase/ring-hydroxylating ferredoxin subunit